MIDAWKICFALCAGVTILAPSAQAQTAAQIAAAPTLPSPAAPAMTPTTDLLGISCAEFISVLSVANPGTNPTADRTSAATRAQRDLYMALIWVNGYITAKTGVPLAQASLTRDWLSTNVAAMAKICKANPNLSIYEAAGKM